MEIREHTNMAEICEIYRSLSRVRMSQNYMMHWKNTKIYITNSLDISVNLHIFKLQTRLKDKRRKVRFESVWIT
jgi:hypothetical protein